MANLMRALGLEREYLADKLAGPLADLMQKNGAKVTAASIRAALLDPATAIAFPSFSIHRVADEVVVEVVEVVEVTEVVTTSAGTPAARLTRIIEGPAAKSA